MTKKYNQLNREQRYIIESYILDGKSQTFIASKLGVHKSTISRELGRNVPKMGKGAKVYNAINAQIKTQKRHDEKPKFRVFTYAMKLQVLNWMTKRKFSPELVANEWIKAGLIGVSHETVYQFIWHCKHTNQRENIPFKNLYKHLAHGRRHRKRGNYKDSRGIIPNRVSIEQRPKIVEERKRYGDYEVDLIMGKNHKSALLVMVDRATLITTINKMNSKNSKEITKMIIKTMKRFPPIKTMTFDNDLAFSQHEKIAKVLNLDAYFTRPYTSQDKGTVENRNGVIRRFFPKKTDFNLISHAEVKRVEKEINNRPIRKFGYKSANEVFLQLKVSVALTG